MKIYFDGTLIDSQYYTDFKVSYKMFDDNEVFSLGKTPCKQVTLGIYIDGMSSIPSEVTIEIDNETYGTFGVDNCELKDYNYELTLTDRMVDFNFNYNAEDLIKNSPTLDDGVPYVTLLQILQDICLKANITLNTTSFYGSNKHISWWDNTVTAREYIGYIAELNGGFARINKDGELELVQFSNTPVHTISLDDVDGYSIGEYHQINHVVYDNGIGVLYEYGEGENTVRIDENNPYITQTEDVAHIYNTIDGLEFYSISVVNCEVEDLMCGDCLEYTQNETSYKTFVQYEWDYFGGFIGGYNFSVGSNEQENTTDIIGDEAKYKRLKTLVDRNTNSIQILSEEIADISTTVDGTGHVSYTNASEGALGEIHITGTVEKWYPSNNETGTIGLYSGTVKSGVTNSREYVLANTSEYPSETLYPKDTYIAFITENETTKYKLPIDVLRVYENISDEFVWTVSNGSIGKMKIIRRVGIRPNGNKYILDNVVEEDLGEMEIIIPSGDGMINFESFPYAHLSVTYMYENEYTKYFSTKAETKAGITVASNQILSVTELKTDAEEKYTEIDQKVDDTNAQIVLKANANNKLVLVRLDANPSTGSTFDVDADNINFNGKTFNLTTEDIAIISTNCSLDTNGNLTCSNANVSGTITSSNATITGGSIELTSNSSVVPRLKITGTGLLEGQESMYMPAGVNFRWDDTFCDYNASRLYSKETTNNRNFNLGIGSNNVNLELDCPGTSTEINIDCYDNSNIDPKIEVKRSSTYTSITQNGVWSPAYNNTSLESKKKNIELDGGCLEQILETDICSFNWKFEDDGDQKHIGCIIADEGGDYKVAPKVLTHDKDAIDLYSMSGMSWKAIQELYDIIELQQNKINELEERLNGITESN